MAFVLVIFEVLSVLFPDYSRPGAKNQGRGGIPAQKNGRGRASDPREPDFSLAMKRVL
jgi:hypothetical protein